MIFQRYGLIALSLMLVLPACGGKSDEKAKTGDEKAAEKIVENAIRKSSGREVEVNISGETVRFTGEDGDLTISGGSGVKLPEDFPGDIPIYKGATLHTSAMSRQEESITANWTTGDDISKVAGFVKAEMEKNGWKSETTLDMPMQTILSYTKGDRGVSFMIAGSGEQTTINMSTAKE